MKSPTSSPSKQGQKKQKYISSQARRSPSTTKKHATTSSSPKKALQKRGAKGNDLVIKKSAIGSPGRPSRNVVVIQRPQMTPLKRTKAIEKANAPSASSSSSSSSSGSGSGLNRQKGVRKTKHQMKPRRSNEYTFDTDPDQEAVSPSGGAGDVLETEPLINPVAPVEPFLGAQEGPILEDFYKVDETPIGQGITSVVVKANSLGEPDQTYAIKILLDLEASPENVKGEYDLLEAAAKCCPDYTPNVYQYFQGRIRSENILRTIWNRYQKTSNLALREKYGSVESLKVVPFRAYVMELIQGKTLEQYLKMKAQPDERLLFASMIAPEIWKGLACLHKLGLAVRDLKPDNLMIVPPDNKIRFFDFGYGCTDCDRIQLPQPVGDQPGNQDETQTLTISSQKECGFGKEAAALDFQYEFAAPEVKPYNSFTRVTCDYYEKARVIEDQPKERRLRALKEATDIESFCKQRNQIPSMGAFQFFEKADIYSSALVVAYAILGRLPNSSEHWFGYEGDEIVDDLRKMKKMFTDKEELQKYIDMLSRALSRDPEQRPSAIENFRMISADQIPTNPDCECAEGIAITSSMGDQEASTAEND